MYVCIHIYTYTYVDRYLCVCMYLYILSFPLALLSRALQKKILQTIGKSSDHYEWAVFVRLFAGFQGWRECGAQSADSVAP